MAIQVSYRKSKSVPSPHNIDLLQLLISKAYSTRRPGNTKRISKSSSTKVQSEDTTNFGDARNENTNSTSCLNQFDTWCADDQANSFADAKDQCNGKGADSSRKLCIPATQTSWVIVFTLRGTEVS